MSFKLGKDALYFSGVVKNMGGAMEGLNFNFGLLCITEKKLYYIPKHILDMKRTGIITKNYPVKEQNVKPYMGKNLEEVVPALAAELKDNQNFDKFMNQLAKTIEGNLVINLSNIHNCSFGYFSQFTFFNGGEKYRFYVGGKKKRENIKLFLRRRNSFTE